MLESTNYTRKLCSTIVVLLTTVLLYNHHFISTSHGKIKVLIMPVSTNLAIFNFTMFCGIIFAHLLSLFCPKITRWTVFPLTSLGLMLLCQTISWRIPYISPNLLEMRSLLVACAIFYIIYLIVHALTKFKSSLMLSIVTSITALGFYIAVAIILK